MKSIDVIVKADGSSNVTTSGFTGSECQDASRFLESALGESNSEQRTAEFYRCGVTQQQQTRQ